MNSSESERKNSLEPKSAGEQSRKNSLIMESEPDRKNSLEPPNQDDSKRKWSISSRRKSSTKSSKLSRLVINILRHTIPKTGFKVG